MSSAFAIMLHTVPLKCSITHCTLQVTNDKIAAQRSVGHVLYISVHPSRNMMITR